MTELFLIAHKVHNEPAFDIACQIPCPECIDIGPEPTCLECDGTGYWWIIPTSGHRAYPWWSCPDTVWNNTYVLGEIPPMPPTLPDHYAALSTPTTDLATALGLRGRKVAVEPTKPFPRRI